jgi:dTDP-glucose 4,6-dehydratase
VDALRGNSLVKIFVTGGAGFIGSNFVRYVLSLGEGHSIVNFDKLTYAGNLANLDTVAGSPRYRFVKGDICDPEAVTQAMEGCEVVVHFAAESHVDRSIYDPAPVIQTNVTGTFILLQVARMLNIRRFLHISTDEVYGDLPPDVIADENCPLQPSSPYAASKAASDLLVRSFVRTYGFPALVTRSSNNYGPYQFPEKFLPLMISNALEDKPLPVYGDGRQQRDWLHVEDNCRGLWTVLQRGRVGEVYNLGCGQVFANLQVVWQLLKLMGKPESLITYVADRPGHDRRYALDCSKIEKELQWRPQIQFDGGLEQTVKWYRENTHWVEAVRRGEYRSYYAKYYENRSRSLEAVMSAGRDRTAEGSAGNEAAGNKHSSN